MGDVFGSALAAEGIFAFFLESGFLAILLFGWDKVGPQAALLRHLHGLPGGAFQRRLDRRGQLLAADPGRLPHRGRGRRRPRAEITDFWAMVFNPSSMDRLGHTLCGAWQAGAFLVLSVSAFYLLRRSARGLRPGARCKVGLVVGAGGLAAAAGHRPRQRGGRRREPAGQAGRLRGALRHRGTNAPLHAVRLGGRGERRPCSRRGDPGHAELAGARRHRGAGDGAERASRRRTGRRSSSSSSSITSWWRSAWR